MLIEYMDTITIRGQSGPSLDEVLYETGVETVRAASFYLIGTAGERYQVSGSELSGAILVPLETGGARVLWAEEYDYPDIDNLMRIKLVD